jgi:hypothetical protein
VEIVFLMLVICIKIFLKVDIAEFVTLLMLTIFLTVFLHSIIRQMNEIIFAILHIILE